MEVKCSLHLPKMIYYILFADNIRAIKSIWVIGDNFLQDMFYTFRAMKTNTSNRGRPNPYLFENYNVEAFCTPKQINNRSVLSRILNATVKAINNSPQGHLPKYLMLILDLDIIVNAQVFDYGVTKTLEDLCKWLLININNAVETKKADLLST